MNALLAIPAADITETEPGVYALGTKVVGVEQLPGFYVVRNEWSLHKRGTMNFSGTTYRLFIAHGPRSGFQWLKGQGYECLTLKEAENLAGAKGAALRAAWKHWLVDGTLTTGEGDIAVTGYPWTFSGAPGLGVDGAMNVSALVRPYPGITTFGYPDDHDGDGSVD